MTETFRGRDDGPIPVIARAASVSYQQPPGAQRKADYALSEDRGRALELAVGPRMKPWAGERVLAELAAVPAVANAGDAIVRREYGRHGYLEVTLLEAHAPLASRYLAVSRLAEGERALYLDALIDDTLADRAGVQTITLVTAGDPRIIADAHGAAATPTVTAAP
jgi:hypothetical protein